MSRIDSLAQGQALAAGAPARRTSPTNGAAFKAALNDAMSTASPVRFSAHAQDRLATRGISLQQAEHAQLGAALDAAARKGARETLLLMDGVALVANVPNRTIITAIAPNESEHSVFTQIDSAVVVAPAATETDNHQSRLDPDAGSLRAAERSTRHTLQGVLTHG